MTSHLRKKCDSLIFGKRKKKLRIYDLRSQSQILEKKKSPAKIYRFDDLRQILAHLSWIQKFKFEKIFYFSYLIVKRLQFCLFQKNKHVFMQWIAKKLAFQNFIFRQASREKRASFTDFWKNNPKYTKTISKTCTFKKN